MKTEYDIIIIGSGHAGCEAGYAAAKMGKKTLLLTMNLDSIAFLACNPSIGGTAKGQLAGEVTALGGAIGKIADKTAIQMRVLNEGKGPAVQSLRAQVDKYDYHTEMKKLLENTQNLFIVQGEATDILVSDGHVVGVCTALGVTYSTKAIVVATGVYLSSEITIGDYKHKSGPNGFSSADTLSACINRLGHKILRFKTGTPARIHIDSVNLGQFELQNGCSNLHFGNSASVVKNEPCYLGYTNAETHKVIRDNLHLAPVFNGTIFGVGPRYCPSIETKVTRFADKERHQIFLEPESHGSKEMYVQGLSSSFGADMQEKIYSSISGMENVQIMRYAYAIEYDCIDPLSLTPGLQSKIVGGLFFAGQINGTSGYEEAAAQGIMAGINAALFLDGEPAFVLQRNEAYIGVLIDDLVTRGVDEPYRMMTSRAEFRLLLRQDNCDLRLTKYGLKYGLVSTDDELAYTQKLEQYARATEELKITFSPQKVAGFFDKIGESQPKSGISLREIIRRNYVTAKLAQELGVLSGYSDEILELVNTEVKYEGYIAMQLRAVEEQMADESVVLPNQFDYSTISGLRLEAQQKLNDIAPRTLGQAGRISGVSPADINVLIIFLKQNKL